MNKIDLVVGLVFVGLIAVVLIPVLYRGNLSSSKIEHFNIMCANELGPTFYMQEAKGYDMVGNVIVAEARNGNPLTYIIPTDVFCIVDPVTTEELNQQGAMPNGNDRLPEQNL